MQYHYLQKKQREHNEKYKDGKIDYRVNESWYWLILYHLKRFAERHRKSDANLSVYSEIVMKDILANTYNGTSKIFFSKNHVLNYYAIAARWAELELRTIRS
jgi:hypothetical protein